jgi:hypothetical protein
MHITRPSHLETEAAPAHGRRWRGSPCLRRPSASLGEACLAPTLVAPGGRAGGRGLRPFGRLAFALVVAATLTAACKDEGGELRDVTARRRAELANRDTTRDAADDTAGPDTGYAIPAFIGDTPAVSARRDSAARDSAKAPAPSGEWTAGTREARHANVVGIVRGFRVAGNDGFDRLVLDFGDGPLPGWRVEYVEGPVRQCGSGRATQVAGQAWLRVRLRTAQAHDDAGVATVRQRDVPLGLPVMRQLAMTCDFEGDVEVVLGLSSANPYRVMELRGPQRLVVDVRQKP